MKKLITSILALLLVLIGFPVYGEFGMVTEEVTITTEDTTVNGAIALAQRLAIEQVAGVYIKSKTSVKNFQVLQDEILTTSEGFIDTQKILEQKEDAKTKKVKVKIQFKVKSKDLAKAIDELADLILKTGNKRIMLFIDETHDNQVAKISSLQTGIEDLLIGRSFPIIDVEYSNKIRAEERTLMQEILNSDSKAAELARQKGAEIVIIGTAKISYDKFDGKFHQAMANIILKAVNASTAQKLASKQASISGGETTKEGAYMAAGKRGGQEIGEQLTNDFIRALLQEMKQGVKIMIVLTGISNYRKQVLPFTKLLKEIPKVKGAEQRSYGGDRAEFEVLYQGTQTDLETAIWEKVDAIPELANLDKGAGAGNAIYFVIK